MAASFWSVLGIDPTPSEVDIRRAYASRLRTTNPEDDAEGFKGLREAYDHALRYARYLQQQSQAEAEPGSIVEAEVSSHNDKEVYQDVGSAILPAVSTSPPADLQSMPLESAALHPDEIERRAHSALCQRLLVALTDNVPYDEIIGAFEAVCSSPAMQQIDVFTGTEAWVAQVITASHPASDPILDSAISFFQWDKDEVGDRNGPAQHVLAFRDHVREEQEANRMLARFKDRKHEYHAAWKETMQPPSQRGWLNKLTSYNRTPRVMEFLAFIRGRNLTVLRSLNPEAVAWWQKRGPVGLRVAGMFRLWLVVIGCFAIGILWFNLIGFIGGDTTRRQETAIAAVSRPMPSVRPAAVSNGQTYLDLVPADASEAVKRRAARRDCREAVKRLGDVPAGVKTFATTRADISCKKILEMTPDSLLMRQYAGIVALRLAEPEVALDHFEAILDASPDDAYALFGKGFVSTLGPDGMGLSDPKHMSDALAINADVTAYFETFGLTKSDVKASPRKPRSRMPQAKPIIVDTDAVQLENPNKRSGDVLAEHFGLDGVTAGVVVLECAVNAKGAATNCHIKSEEPFNVGLGEVGLLAMQDVRFQPPMFEGEPVAGLLLTYTLRYNVRDKTGDEATP